MKRIYFIAMLLLSAGLSACVSINESEDILENCQYEEVVIHATHEYDCQTKTILQDDGSVWWNPDDEIGVFFGSHYFKFRACIEDPSPVADFIGNVLVIDAHNENSDGESGIYDYWGICPSESVVENYTLHDYPSRECDTVSVYLPYIQNAVAGTFDSNCFISIAKSHDYSKLSFYNLCGGLAFCVERDGINKVTFSGNSGEILAGGVDVVMNSQGRPVVSKILEGTTEITLSLDNGEYFLPGEWYYIVMLPTVLENGYTMTFHTDNKKATLVSTDSVEVKRSVFGRLTNADAGQEFEFSPAYSVDDVYSMFNGTALPEYSSSWYSYICYFMYMTELRGDNVTLSGPTTHPTYADISYSDTPESDDVRCFWDISYRIIEGCNQNIETLSVGESQETDHIIGECYFLRAISHFNLVNIYATPYSRGKEMPGVVLRTSTDPLSMERATVGAVYDQIVADLEVASELMRNGTRRGDAGFVSYESARALLTRVHLYSGYYNDCISIASEMIGDDPGSHLDDITTYYPNTKTSNETLWCIAKSTEDSDFLSSPKGQLASMYYSINRIGDSGWCEMYWSDPLMELMLRHPEDKRLSMLGTLGATNDGTVMIHWPIDEGMSCHYNAIVHNIKDFDKDAESNTIRYNGRDYIVWRTTERTGYPEYYIKDTFGYGDDDGFDLGTKVYVRDNVSSSYSYVRRGFPAYTMAKFSWQDGHPMLASPALIRWAEVILNIAEAYAHIGDEANALKYVNVIRDRAGIPVWTGKDMYHAEGYSNILDVVLDERRLELCFEGHRAIDLYRNEKSIDRRFSGVHTWEILDPGELDYSYPYCIPSHVMKSDSMVGNGRN